MINGFVSVMLTIIGILRHHLVNMLLNALLSLNWSILKQLDHGDVLVIEIIFGMIRNIVVRILTVHLILLLNLLIKDGLVFVMPTTTKMMIENASIFLLAHLTPNQDLLIEKYSVSAIRITTGILIRASVIIFQAVVPMPQQYSPMITSGNVSARMTATPQAQAANHSQSAPETQNSTLTTNSANV
jgi:hypothetical protein